MNNIINIALAGYGCYVLYLYSQGQVSYNIFGFNVGEMGFLGFWGLFTAYCFYNVYKGNRHRF